MNDQPPSSSPAPFGAAKATATLLLVFLGQVAVAFAIAFVPLAMTMVRQARPLSPAETQALIQEWTNPMMFGAVVASALVTIAATRLWAWHLLRDRSPAGLGLVCPPWSVLRWWMAAGALIAIAYLAVAVRLVPMKSAAPVGPLTQMAASGGAGTILWAIMALLLSPPVEEFLFRGLLWRGFTNSWGAPLAGLVITLVFWASHLGETAHYWPAATGVMALAVATLTARIVTGSVVAAMLTHLAYNAVLVLAVYAGRIATRVA